MKVLEGGRHGEPGYYSLADLPQRGSVKDLAIGTGWWEMDQIWKLYPGQFNMITGLAGSGKSTFLMNVMCNIAQEYGTRTFMYVPENEGYVKEKLKGIWGDRGDFDEFCRVSCFIQSSYPNDFESDPKTLPWILKKAITAIDKDGVDLLMIDPWNEIERAKPANQLLTDYIGECLMYLKQFCRSRNVCIMLVAHPTKAGIVDGKVPTLADIEGSMNWYNKCDNGLIVMREGLTNVTKVVSAKVRENGAGKLGVCHFFVNGETGLFTPQ